jgi:hypothetical protein
MWIRKIERDLKKDVDSPLPTQAVSNEEFLPRPQTQRQKQLEALIREMGDTRARKLNMDRRAFMASSMGLATCFAASNRVYGKVFDVDEAETYELAAIDEKYPKGEFFVIDVQAHFTNGIALNFRNSETARNMGFNLKDDVESYSFKNFVKELFFDSETNMVVISGVPTREIQRTPDGKVAEGAQRNPPFAILPSWLMGEKKKEINDMAGSQRALCQGNLAPNHYWDKAANSIDKAAMLEQMERELQLYKIDSWKWYCHTDPARTGNGFQLDDDNAMWFYEESRKRGMKLVSVHKGYSYQSAIKHGPNEPNYLDSNKFDPKTGDFEWHSVLMDIKKRNPKMSNVYPEVGSFFNALVVADPVLCMHGMGKNLKYYGADHVVWGTDCLWWGSPQWAIEAFKRFDISDEFVEKFGYAKISKADKAKILGLNAAKLYNIDVKAKRNAIPGDALEKAKLAYLDAGGARQNAAYGWVRAGD